MLARRAARHVVRGECGEYFDLLKKTTCQVPFNWTNNNLFKFPKKNYSSGCPSFPKPVEKIQFRIAQ